MNNLGGSLGINDPLTSSNNWEKVIYYNLFVAIEINRHIIPYMKKKKWGRICHVSSISALENQGAPSYCASKSALNAYVRSVGRFVAKDNIVMTSVMPGPVFAKGNSWDLIKKTNLKVQLGGGGNMGASIAYALARASITVTLVEMDAQRAADARRRFSGLVEQGTKKGVLTEKEANSISSLTN